MSVWKIDRWADVNHVFHFLSIIAITIYLSFSLEPEWAKILVIDGVKMSEKSLPFYMFIRFDKLALGLVIMSLIGFGFQPFKNSKAFKVGFLGALSLIALLIGVAISISYVEWDPKLPPETLIFMLNNLLIVCVAEEAIFRRYIQSSIYCSLRQYKYATALSILLASVIFGLAHMRGGLIFVLLATIAGVFYGYCYQKTGRIESSVLCHFGLNAVHFLMFSYPALSLTA